MRPLHLKESFFQLPSLGLPYDGVELINDDSIKTRPFLAGDQKVIAIRGTDSYRVYFNLLSRVILEPVNFPIDKMLVSDANAVLFASRIMSFGPNYGFRHKCENCDNSGQVSVDLSTVDVTYADDLEEFSATGNNITLARSGDTIEFNLPTLGDEKVVSTYMTSRKKKGTVFGSQLDSTYIRLAQLITSTTGMDENSVKSLDRRVAYLDLLPLDDLNTLVDAVSAHDVGLKDGFSYTCTECGWENEVKLKINEEFFRSNTK